MKKTFGTTADGVPQVFFGPFGPFSPIAPSAPLHQPSSAAYFLHHMGFSYDDYLPGRAPRL
jgi:hypothetical protein